MLTEVSFVNLMVSLRDIGTSQVKALQKLDW